jgi:hypothetical protein
MGEGLSATEVGKEIGEHARHAGVHGEVSFHDRMISIAEAVLLSVVTIIAAWSGYSAAKWGTEASLHLAKAATVRAKANRAFQQSFTVRSVDASTFNAWYTAYVAHDANAMRVARKRFRPGYRVAFVAWLGTHPFTNRNAPGGPQQMPQYHPVGLNESKVLDAEADHLYAEGQKAAQNGDDYIRTTVVLASVLFLVGISSHFPVRGVRLGLIGLGGILLILAAIQILILPPPP